MERMNPVTIKRRRGKVNRPGKNQLPQRSCSVCGKKSVKSGFTRVAMFGVEKRLTLDASGTLGGRGLYLCKSNDCVNNFIKLVRKGKIKNTGIFPGWSRERLIESIQKSKLRL
jgi:predicted RNA-binding protein YlxR (DUF448 family)